MQSSFTGTIEKVVSVGIIANELITNAMKHADPGDKGLEIYLSFSRESTKIVLSISDNGVQTKSVTKSGGVGTLLIHNLVEQLNGTITISHTDGYSVRITIPDLTPHRSDNV